ncbi:MAG: GPW/gp25 family protein [Gemmataceae bacterium]
MEFLGKGWAFPIYLGRKGGFELVSDETVIRNSLFLILSTAPGERLMRPTFGCGIHDLVFQPNTPSLRGEIEVLVREALIEWEPRIDVLKVHTDTSLAEPTQLLIRIDYRVRSNNSLYNLVYPFYLLEGPR